MTLVYLDTSVWLSLANRKDRNHEKAKLIAEKIRSGTYTALVSRHVLSEVLDVLRRNAAAHARVKVSADAQVHRALVEQWYADFAAKVIGAPNVRIQDTPAPTAEILTKQLGILSRMWGKVVSESRCPVCGSQHDYVEYDGPNRDDALHMVIADKINCDRVVTFDSDFTLFSGIQALSHIAIDVL